MFLYRGRILWVSPDGTFAIIDKDSLTIGGKPSDVGRDVHLARRSCAFVLVVGALVEFVIAVVRDDSGYLLHARQVVQIIDHDVRKSSGAAIAQDSR